MISKSGFFFKLLHIIREAACLFPCFVSMSPENVPLSNHHFVWERTCKKIIFKFQIEEVDIKRNCKSAKVIRPEVNKSKLYRREVGRTFTNTYAPFGIINGI